MKKYLIILLSLVFSISLVKAQNAKVVSAFNYYRSGQLDKAKEAIDEASVNPKTSVNAKTWFYLGNIYLGIYMSKDETIHNLSSDALQIAYDAYQKSIEIDKDIANPSIVPPVPKLGLFIIGEQHYNIGVNLYNEKKYEEAIAEFEKTIKINNIFGIRDSLATFNASLCAYFLKYYEKSKKYLKELVNMEFGQTSIYTTLAEIYRMESDTTKAINTLKLGRERFPDNNTLLIAEVNVYLAKGQNEKANQLLQEAVTKDPTNPILHFAVGSTYDQLATDTTLADSLRTDFIIKSEAAYRKALKINPNYFDAYYNLGALFVNQAATKMDEANKLPLNAVSEYDKIKAEADGFMIKAAPELEKALQIKPNDFNTLVSLKQIYARTNQYEKLKEINRRLEELKAD